MEQEQQNFEAWFDQASTDQLEAAKVKAAEIGNAYVKKTIISAEGRILKALLRNAWLQIRTEKIKNNIKSDLDRKLYLQDLFNDPDNWVDRGSYFDKWDPVTRTVLRKPKHTYRSDNDLKDTWSSD